MPIQTIPAKEASLARDREPTIPFLDVRTPAEYEQSHARGAQSVPLDQLDESIIRRTIDAAAGKPVYVICKSGVRAAKAAEQFVKAGCRGIFSVDGGTTAWERAGLPIDRGNRRSISVERQVRIAAGALVVTGVVLGLLVHPGLLGISAIVGAGLVFAGVTDWCGMGLLIAKMPWNR